MIKNFFIPFIVLSSFVISSSALAEDLSLVKGRSYVLAFDEEIINFHADEKTLDAQLVHTIFDDKKQLIVSLKTNEDSILQVKTEHNFYKYNIKNSATPTKDLIEIDLPPAENFEIDVFEGV